MSFPLTGTGIWSPALRNSEPAAAADLAAELEGLGYTALCIPDSGGDVFGAVENLLAATKTATIATGILNLWMHEPKETAAEHARLSFAYEHRFLVGIGVSHARLIDAQEAGRYRNPLARTREFLDALDAAPTPLPVDDRVLAALGPKMLELARNRAAGAHPYLVTPEHTNVARRAVGPRKLVVPEQGVVLETDADRARTIARRHLANYLTLPNYSNNWKRFGFTDDDLGGGGTDRLVDALVAWGDEAAIAPRVQEHRDAGADHVCLQVLAEDTGTLAIDDCRRLAAVVND
ncbi:MAG TPA: TIGR03620 family F420-dependent LLM class oxidoreductase [Acidimicrobiales bacterium]|nr:TIGR03620 family F420-dependent LLM class oxidoreductase [Acidimicrobiales bacterium]